jgi:hypothetical protein
MVKDNPDYFTFSAVSEGTYEVKDFQTAGVVAFARGTPFVSMQSGSLSVAGQRVKVDREQLDQNRDIIVEFASRFW